MKKKIAIAASAVLAFVLLSGFRGGGWGWHRDPERIKQMITWRLDDKLEDLQATDAQKQAVHGVADRLFEEGKLMAQEHEGVRVEVLTQLESDYPDSQKLHSIVDTRMGVTTILAVSRTQGSVYVSSSTSAEAVTFRPQLPDSACE